MAARCRCRGRSGCNCRSRRLDRGSRQMTKSGPAGLDIQTVFSCRSGRARFRSEPIPLRRHLDPQLQYPTARDSRINKGLRRRANQTVFGFYIDPRSGIGRNLMMKTRCRCTADVVKPVGSSHRPRPQERTSLPVPRACAYAAKTTATVRRPDAGIAVVFHSKKGNPWRALAARDNRRAILAYEATEGGAGVLSRLVEIPGPRQGCPRS